MLKHLQSRFFAILNRNEMKCVNSQAFAKYKTVINVMGDAG